MPNFLRIIFAGTPDFAAYHLNRVISSKHQVVGVLTRPDRPAGRGKNLTASPVKIIAQNHAIPVYQPVSLRCKENQHIIMNIVTEKKADIIVVVAYGLLLPLNVLNMPRLGCINVHGSLLPRWRGAAPIQRALLSGDQESGISIMKMNVGLDTGDVLHKSVYDIKPDDTSMTLYKELSVIGSEALLKTLQELADNNVRVEIQNEQQATYAEKLTKKEAKLDWSLPALQLERCIRAFNPWPVSYFIVDKYLIKVWKAQVLTSINNFKPGTIINADKKGIQVATAKDVLNIIKLQIAGKRAMSASCMLNARRQWFTIGRRLQ